MAEISPVPMTADYKTELNCWEETMEPNKSPDNESEFVEVGVTESNVQDVAICHTYTVGSEDSGSLPCESGSPVASEHLKVEDRPVAVGYGYQEYDLSVQRAVSPQVFTVDRQQEDPHQLSVEPCSVVMSNCRGEVHQPPPPPSYGSEALTQLANCCSQLNDQLQNGSMVSPVVNIPDTHQGQTSIHVQLESAELWQQFFSVDTEMIITKAGRRMFPGISTTVFGLEPDVKYTLQMEMCPASKNRYKYINSKWMSVGKGEPHDASQLLFVHPDSPASGKQWMRDKVSFKKVKLTNDKNSKKGYVVLNSMHKYQPRIHILRHLTKKDTELVYSVDFPQTQFVAVTAYQNDLVTQLKIDNNPFAKAFRESDDQQYGYPGVMMPGGWGMPTTPINSPAESSYSNGPNSISPMSPLPQFGMAFGNWDVNSRPPISPFLNKSDRSMGQWPYPLPISPSVTAPMMMPSYPNIPLSTSVAAERSTYSTLPPPYMQPATMPTYSITPNDENLIQSGPSPTME